MKRVLKHLFAVVMLLFLGAAVCGANLIAYNTGPTNHNFVMVMDDQGTNPIQLHDGGKFAGALFLTISPRGLDGQAWVVFENYDLYKVRQDGSNLTKMLCFEGTDKSGDPYFLLGSPQWSPDGSEILVHLARSDPWIEHFATLPADAEVTLMPDGTEDCLSPNLVPIPYLVRDTSDLWVLEGMAAWNDTGSEIAFFEFGTDVEENENVRLTILNRPEGIWAVRSHFELNPRPTYPGFSYPLSIDWQRNGNLLAFSLREETDRRPNFWLAFIDASNGSWWRHEEGGEWVEGRDPSWSPDGSQLIYNDLRGNLFRLTLSTGEIELLVSGERADWQRDLVVGVCGDGDCTGSETRCNCSLDCGAYPSTETDLCTDFVNNDCDDEGIDCDDSDCDTDAACIEPFCGDGTCDPDETQCGCPEDCGAAPFTEDSCTDGVDNDCFGDIDCDDPDCSDDSVCTSTCVAKGKTCAVNEDCCSGLCHPKKLTCK